MNKRSPTQTRESQLSKKIKTSALMTSNHKKNWHGGMKDFFRGPFQITDVTKFNVTFEERGRQKTVHQNDVIKVGSMPE